MDEIAKYTPQEYSPSKQRNFNGTMVNPGLRPTLGSRPKSAFVTGTEMLSAVGRRVSGGRSSDEARRSEDGGRRSSNDNKRRFSGDRPVLARFNSHEQTRKISGSSTEAAPQEDLNVKKRGGRVMAAVAMFQGKSKDGSSKEQAALDPKAVDAAFEAVLASRNVPEPMRQKMRSLTLRVKADFVKQDQSASSNAAASSPTGTLTAQASKSSSPVEARHEQQPAEEDDSKTTKRSRPRSRTFTFSKSDKRQGETSPTKKQRPQSKSRPTSVHMPKESLSASISNAITPSTPTEHRRSVSLGRKSTAPATPADYITYLKKYQDPTKVEVGRLHKLRILLRNETVAWVDSFISLGGMSEIVALLHRTMAVEWREEHEDQLLHETLLCLKGLCTTERALAELDKVADELFPALLGMLFDDEKKGPAEYTTRNIIVSVLREYLPITLHISSSLADRSIVNFLTAELNSTETALEERARRILAYLGEPTKPDDARPVDFVLDMRVPRPYKLWCREITHVSREVFWIFLHQLNVVPLPKPSSSGTDNGSPVDSVLDADAEERAKVLATTYTQRHFPGSRAPVPAAPYIGGVEWDATTYLSTHLDLLNGLIASLPSSSARNQLRAELQASGFEKVMGGTLRTCKEKFYSSVHDGLRAWVAAAVEDGWDTRYVREGPNMDEQAGRARSCSPKKCPQKKEAAPKLELSLGLDTKQTSNGDDGNDDGWLG